MAEEPQKATVDPAGEAEQPAVPGDGEEAEPAAAAGVNPAVDEVLPGDETVAPRMTGADETGGDVEEPADAAAGQPEKLPLRRRILGVARDISEEVEKNTMAAKVIERVKNTAEEVEKSELAAQVRKAVKDTADNIEKSPLLSAAHRVLLAGIGAVVLAQEEIEDFVNRLVERGEIAEADGRRMLKDVLDKRKSVMKKTADLAEEPQRTSAEVERRVEEVLANMNVPSKDEIETLSAKITALTRKVEELKKQG